jgi:hypothetical protein
MTDEVSFDNEFTGKHELSDGGVSKRQSALNRQVEKLFHDTSDPYVVMRYQWSKDRAKPLKQIGQTPCIKGAPAEPLFETRAAALPPGPRALAAEFGFGLAESNGPIRLARTAAQERHRVRESEDCSSEAISQGRGGQRGEGALRRRGLADLPPGSDGQFDPMTSTFKVSATLLSCEGA